MSSVIVNFFNSINLLLSWSDNQGLVTNLQNHIGLTLGDVAGIEPRYLNYLFFKPSILIDLRL
jgi:hypothetical protein